MEIRDYAEGLLFGATLDEKLVRASDISDHVPGPALARAPRSPGRPANLRFESASIRQRAGTATPRDLEKKENRGALLHQFANHEILAIELMALALLRFPTAPSAFRMSLVQSIQEEQRHFLLYRSRMRKIGFDFGDFGVNDFFWKHLGHPGEMRRPIDFVVRMGMTFEQANLDYMQHYSTIFARLDDRATVAVLNTVLKDEIGHVRNGVHWFEEFRRKDPSDGSDEAIVENLKQLSQWEAYRSLLPETLSPVRARGIGFHEDARRQAGLSAEYIEALRLFAYSRGRPPALYWFNPGCEEAAAEYSRLPRSVDDPGDGPAPVLSNAVRNLETDLEMVMLFLAGHEDALLVRKTPRPEFLSEVQRAGFAIPEIYCQAAEPQTIAAGMSGRKLSDARPWGPGPDSLTRLRPYFAQVIGRRGEQLIEGGENEYLDHIRLYSRSFGLEVEAEFARRSERSNLEGAGGAASDTVELASVENPAACVAPENNHGIDCQTPEEIAGALARLRSMPGVDAAVIKARFGTAGRNRKRIDLARDADPRLDAWISRALAAYGGAIVEAWRERCADYSVQFTVEEAERVVVHGVTRLINDRAGQFVGILTGRIFDGLPPDTRRHLAGSAGVVPILQEAARFAGARLAARGYRGPAGIDAFAWNGKRGLQFRPICEINVRYTMGRVALEIGRRIRAHRASLWLSVHIRDVRKWLAGREIAAASGGDAPAGEEWPQWSAAIRSAYPLRFAHGLIDSGVLFTTDPLQARDRCTLVVVAPDFAQCLRACAEYGVSVPV